VVVDNLDVFGVAAGPAKANTPLVIDPNAVPAGPVSHQFLEAVSGGSSKINKTGCGIEQDEFSQSDALQIGRESPDRLPLEEPLGVAATKATDHDE
jgi:hypothetical protein